MNWREFFSLRKRATSFENRPSYHISYKDSTYIHHAAGILCSRARTILERAYRCTRLKYRRLNFTESRLLRAARSLRSSAGQPPKTETEIAELIVTKSSSIIALSFLHFNIYSHLCRRLEQIKIYTRSHLFFPRHPPLIRTRVCCVIFCI